MNDQAAHVSVVTFVLWNNKGGVGKTTLPFQLSRPYAHEHPDHAALVVDMCPQSNVSALFSGGSDSKQIMPGQW